MTILEFEAWVSDNYEGLLHRARIVTKSEDGSDLLHQVIEHILEEPDTRLPSGDPFALIYVAMERALIDGLKVEALRQPLNNQIAQDILLLGQDAFVDSGAAARAEARRQATTIRKTVNGKRVRVKIERPTEPVVDLLEWEGPMPGSVRWRFQQLRDGRLFDERAVRSLADSMHRTSQRYRHFGRAGYSHVEFGTEEVHA